MEEGVSLLERWESHRWEMEEGEVQLTLLVQVKKGNHHRKMEEGKFS